jgi:long-chain fatty acid transport protein
MSSLLRRLVPEAACRQRGPSARARRRQALVAAGPAAVAALAVLLGLAGADLGGSAACAAGFSFSEQGAKATGMAGAFVAQADDLSAIYYNPGGLGLLAKKKRKAVAAGAAVTAFNQSLYQGLPPGIGTATTGQQVTPRHFPAEAWITLPLGDKVVAGMGAYSPFLMSTEWANPATFAGRFLSVRSQITSYDLSPALGLQLTPEFGIGVAGIYRLYSLTDRRRLSAVDPASHNPVDIASLDMKTDYRGGAGFGAGLLHKPGPRFSWGASYRSAIGTSTLGTSRLSQILTGNAQLDQLVLASFPFGQDVALKSRLRFPWVASAGVAIGLGPGVLLEADASRTGWSSVQRIDFLHPSNSVLDTGFALRFKDASTYRVGLDIKLGQPHLRLGYSYDQSPQPAATVGAYLPDSDRNTFAVGIGRDWLDLAFNWVTYKQRIVTTNVDSLNGNYRANAWLVAVTATH